MWIKHKGITSQQEKLITQDYYSDGSNKIPRYYQLLAINKTIEAISKGQNRILLVMATGTGKTFTAFQIIWRLWKSKTKKRILFLADRNILIDQTMTNDFKPFGSAMTKIKKRQANKSYEIYLSLYQAVTGSEEDRIFNQKDFDKSLVLEKRTELVAKKVTEFLKQTNRFDKTIVFCDNIDHAERMRQALVNGNSDLVKENYKYIMRITGDNEEGKDELDNFIFPESKYPVIATTSDLMTTGVDAQTCKLIVLDKRIQNMTTFKQIIGRGTRIHEDYNKYYFTIIDFKKATELFADPDFDGDPVVVYEPGVNESPVPPDDIDDDRTKTTTVNEPGDYTESKNPFEDINFQDGTKKIKRYVVSNVNVTIASERVQYFDANGKLITESLKDYTKKTLYQEFTSLDDFLNKWNLAEIKQVIIEELANQGIFFEALAEEVGINIDPFDIICHVAWDKPPLTRKERAENVKKRNYFTKYGEKARKVLEALLEKYADSGITNIEETQILTINPFTKFGTIVEIINSFGGQDKYLKAVQELEQALYCA